MKLLYFDIETACAYENFTYFKSLDPRGADLFEGKAKRNNWMKGEDTIAELYLKKAALFFEYSKVVCISFGYDDVREGFRVRSYTGDERKIISDSSKIINNFVKNGFLLCGYNILNFDLPLLNIKHYKYDIPMHPILDMKDKKPWEIEHVDIHKKWNHVYGRSASLDEVCYVLGIESPKSTMSGTGVHNEFYAGNIDKIVEYCEGDVKVLPQIIERLY